MQLNFFLCAAIAAFIPLLVGFIWYHPKVFGTVWMKANNFTDPEKMKEGFNMPLVFGLTYAFGFLMSIALTFSVIHQTGLFSMLNHHLKEEETQKLIGQIMGIAGNDFRTFKHGALHGGITGVFFVMPIIAINAMFERKGFKYIALTTGYWVLSLVLMGAFLCQFVDLKSMG